MNPDRVVERLYILKYEMIGVTIGEKARSIMLNLKKIKRNNEFIEAYYTPEHSEEEGYIKIRLSDGGVVEKKLTSYDRILATYFGMAKFKLRDLINDTNIPNEAKVMWY